MLEFLGFVSLESTLWNVVGYGAFIGIIVGVLSEGLRKPLFVIGPILLALYAGLFLHDPLFTSLQILITVSGVLQLANVPRRTSMVVMVIATIVAYLFLIFGGILVDVWAVIGSLGLLGIAFVIIRLPKPDVFLLMAAGGALLVIYGFVVEAWVFFFLNIFFAIANVREAVLATQMQGSN